MKNKFILIVQNLEMSVFTTNIQHIANMANVRIYLYIYIYIHDNKNLVPFWRLRYSKLIWREYNDMAERRLWIMPFKDAQSFHKSRRHLKILDANYVPWRKFHTEIPPISRHCCRKYSLPGDVPPMICAPLLLLKIIFIHNSMHLMLQVHRTEKREGGQHQTTDFNSEGTELCWIFCSQMNIFP